MRFIRLFLLLPLVFALYGCVERSTAPEPAATASAPSAPSGYVSKAIMGKEWPLTVKDGVLGCTVKAFGEHTLKVVTFTTPDGKVYAVNGGAMTLNIGKDIAPIWAKGADKYIARKDIGPLIDRGLALCP